jgi:tetrahydromethanopterin S-methyltransferase subunit D
MVMLWVNLATTMNVSMAWLRGRYALGAVFGAIGGPLAYYSGAKLGAMTRLPEPGGLLWIGVAWAIALPLLYGAARKINERFHGLDTQ